MAWFTRLSRFTILAMALSLGLAANVPTQVQAQSRPSSLSNRLQNAFRAPRTPTSAPINTQGGGTRRAQDELASCIPDNESLVALVPSPETEEELGIGKTAAEYPTIFWYMPQTTASQVEFTLRDAKNQELYSVRYNLAKSTKGVMGAPGIMSLTLPAFSNYPPLEIGQEYHWDLALICDATGGDRSGDIVVSGGIKRVQPSAALSVPSVQATPEQRIAMYADNQLWYETVTALIDLRRARPNDPNLADAWNTLLNSVGLSAVAREPLFQGASNITTNNQ